MTDWTTRIDGIDDEAHVACFAPPGWPGTGPIVALGVPGCKLALGADGEPPDLLEPTAAGQQKGLRYWTYVACAEADRANALLILSSETAEHLKAPIRRVTKLLPRYRRVVLERMYKAETRQRETLS